MPDEKDPLTALNALETPETPQNSPLPSPAELERTQKLENEASEMTPRPSEVEFFLQGMFCKLVAEARTDINRGPVTEILNVLWDTAVQATRVYAANVKSQSEDIHHTTYHRHLRLVTLKNTEK